MGGGVRSHAGTRTTSIYDKMFDKIVLMESYRGSQAHGTEIKPDEKWGTDDIDYITVYAYPKQYYLTLEGYNHAKEFYERMEGEIDEVGYELRKMFSMLSTLNPNVLNALYLRKQDYLKLTPAWEYVIANRDVFLSKVLIRDRYIGYAKAQLHKMDGSGAYRGYMGAKRKQMVKEVGYDTKNASHLIRLLRMGTEFLKDGVMQVYRPDREELIAIKQGKYTIETIHKMADELFAEMERVYEKSTIPEHNNKYDINKLLYETMEIALSAVADGEGEGK